VFVSRKNFILFAFYITLFIVWFSGQKFTAI